MIKITERSISQLCDNFITAQNRLENKLFWEYLGNKKAALMGSCLMKIIG
jgi:hypothetical protein